MRAPHIIGEKTLAQQMAQANKEMKAGIEVHMLATPTDASKGLGMFDALNGFEDAAALAHRLPPFSQRCANPTNVTLGLPSSTARFGLAAVAGELATAMGITGWPDGTATTAVRVSTVQKKSNPSEKDVFIFIHNSKHLIPLNPNLSDNTTGHVVAPKIMACGCDESFHLA